MRIEALSDLHFEPDFNSPESVWLGIADSLRQLLRDRVEIRAGIIGFDSVIISEIPELFTDFGGKHISLLWRDDRDCFGAKDFRDRCDGHSPTLTLIEDTSGNIFGGFTPVAWDSSGSHKGDQNLTTFLFTLTNPHNLPPPKFALKAEQKDEVLASGASRGRWFHGPAIGITNNSNANTDDCTYKAYKALTTLVRSIPTTPMWTGKRFSRVRGISK
jgi:hypothetical protein